jgi:uncharacterized protein YhbP (UPF0306 family)
MDKRISNFIEQQKTATICCLDESNDPYCFTVFFVFDKTEKRLLFKSSGSANHSKWLLRKKAVAGTILPDKLDLLAIRGVQFVGCMMNSVDPSGTAWSQYHKKLPLAIAMPGEVWTIQLESIKLTDNSFGIGRKILWNREVDAGNTKITETSPYQQNSSL